MIGEKPRVYIMGPMAGLPDYNRDAFYDETEKLRKQGFWPIHSADMVNGLKEYQYEAESYKRIKTCQYYVLLTGWETSSFATRELQFAIETGLREIKHINQYCL